MGFFWTQESSFLGLTCIFFQDKKVFSVCLVTEKTEESPQLEITGKFELLFQILHIRLLLTLSSKGCSISEALSAFEFSVVFAQNIKES
ncbi:hypothetical protein ACSBR2_007390 [Camellia fascicularis]